MQLRIDPGVTTIADCSEMEGDALSNVDGEGALLNPINFLREKRDYKDEDQRLATMVDVPPKDCSFPRKQRPRPIVLMISDEIEGEETTGGGGGAEVEMDTETSEVEDSVNGAIGIGGNYSAASAEREKVSKVPSVVRRAFSFPVSVEHSSSLVAAGPIQPDVLVLPRQTSEGRKEVNPALGSFSSSQTQQRGPMAVEPARQEEAQVLTRRPSPPPPDSRTNDEIIANSAARPEREGHNNTRRLSVQQTSFLEYSSGQSSEPTQPFHGGSRW